MKKDRKILSAVLLLLAAAGFYPAAAQPIIGQKGVVCTSYNQCNDVEIGYFIFPNPVKNILYVDLTSREEASIILDVFDASGKPTGVFQEKVSVMGRSSTEMKMSHLASGYYFLHIKDLTRQTLQILKFQKE